MRGRYEIVRRVSKLHSRKFKELTVPWNIHPIDNATDTTPIIRQSGDQSKNLFWRSKTYSSHAGSAIWNRSKRLPDFSKERWILRVSSQRRKSSQGRKSEDFVHKNVNIGRNSKYCKCCVYKCKLLQARTIGQLVWTSMINLPVILAKFSLIGSLQGFITWCLEYMGC